MIQIDPDDTELKESIYRVNKLKAAWERADNAWDRLEPSAYEYTRQFEHREKARLAYESELINLALIFMERL
jgi:hypothetical protein